MKTRIALGFCLIVAFVPIIFPDAVNSADAGPVRSAVAVSFLQGEFFPGPPQLMSYPAPSPLSLQASRFPLISAQQACRQGGGWNWRQGQVPMCFKSGHDICPAGHPWMRQMTQRYTICLSAGSSVQSPLGMGIH